MFSLIQKVIAVTDTTGSNPTGLNIKAPGTLPTDVCTLLTKISDFLFLIVAPLAGLVILWAAFQILTAGGDPAKFATGKRTLVYALVGLGIVILSDGIVDIVIGLLGQTDSICHP